MEKNEINKILFFEKLLKEDDYAGGVCASDFSGFVPEKTFNKKVKNSDDGDEEQNIDGK